MKRRNSFAAFGYFVYLKTIWLKNRLNSVGRPTGPTGKFEWKMSASSSFTFGSVAFFAAKYIEIPLDVSAIWLSRNALLLFGSSHDSVPGTNVAYSCFAYSSAFRVS